MSRAQRSALLMLAVFLTLALFSSGARGFRKRADKDRESLVGPFAKLQRGMTPDQVRHQVGGPKHIARQLLYHRYREQWIYDGPFPIRLTFDCPRGQKPQLLASPVFPD